MMKGKQGSRTGMMQDSNWMIQAELSVQITKSRQNSYIFQDCFVIEAIH